MASASGRFLGALLLLLPVFLLHVFQTCSMVCPVSSSQQRLDSRCVEVLLALQVACSRMQLNDAVPALYRLGRSSRRLFKRL
jgi:hypothetical protein